jgi:hypothetical protein
VNGFIDHIYTRLGTTSDYSATANCHNSQITTARAKPFLSCCVFTSRSLAAASNSGDSSAPRAQVLSLQTPILNSLGLPSCLQGNSSARTTWKHPVSCIVVRRFIVAGTCLPSRCLETALVYSPISRSSHGNGCTRYNVYGARITLSV